jgi:transposase-like protein
MEEKQGRWTAPKKAEVVLRLLRGESMDAVSRECEVTVETLNRWREDFIAAGVAGLKGKTLDQVRIAALEKKIGKQAMELELHEKKDQFMRTRGGRSSK